MVVVTILAPIFVANTISKEYELNNMDMLRMTLMTPRQILFGKWFAGLTMVAPLVLSAMTAWLSFFVMGAHAWSLCITGYTTLFLCAFMSVSFALLASVLAKRTVVAIVASGLLNALVFYGEYVLLRIAGAAEGFPWPQTYSPLVYFYLTKGAEGFSFNGFLNRALYLAMSLFAIMIAIRIFENRRLRDT
jgi:ABC-type transport system involved in multi-copper enzyme maturation permease subunit